MKKLYLTFIFSTISIFIFSQKNAVVTFKNPIDINIGDPYVMQFNNIYYLYGTAGSDGFLCWSSTDMVNWKEEGNVFKETESSYGNTNYWAPEVVNFNNKFYMTYSCLGKNKSHDNKMLLCFAVSDSPTGPFLDLYAPWFDEGYSCIDANLFFDGGEIYLYFDIVGYDGMWPNGLMYGKIFVRKLDKNTLQPISDTTKCIEAVLDWEKSQPNNRTNEGAFVFKHLDKYYMTYSANHYTDENYGIGYATSDSPVGPWIKPAKNRIIQKDTILGVYGPGHCCITFSPDKKEMFIIYHTHISDTNKERKLNIDRISVDDKGSLKVIGPTRSLQKYPSGTVK